MPGAGRQGGRLRPPGVVDRHRRRAARRAAAEAHRALGSPAPGPAVLRAGVGGPGRRAGGHAARRRTARPLPPLPARHPPHQAAPAHRARGARAQREVGHRPARLDPLLRRDARRREVPARRRRHPARGASEQAAPGRPAAPAAGRGFDHRRAADAAAHLDLRVQHLAGRQGVGGPAAQLSVLDQRPQPGQPGRRRHRRRAGGGGGRPLRHRRALLPAQAPAARRRRAVRLRPLRAARRRVTALPLGRGRGDGAVGLPALQRPAGRAGGALLRQRLDRRADPAAQARRRLLPLVRALRPPLPAAQLPGAAARRDDSRARARPRRARAAGRPARVPAVPHAADHRGDRFRVRRGAGLPGPAGT